MAALPRSFGPDVSDTVMRFAVGYPRDRLKATASALLRREVNRGGKCLVEWIYEDNSMLTLLFDRSGNSRDFDRLQYRELGRVIYYGDFCDACGPVELQLQRTHL